MRSASLLKSVYSFIVFVIIFVLSITISSFAQIKQSYRNHEEIEVVGGMKVEILNCSGEGPTEVCDCIYFTDKRQNGTRMKQNANRLKEEERAALLAKGINKPQLKKNNSSIARSTDTRADKAIPKSLTQKPTKPIATRPALEDAVRKADSVAKASSQKMKEMLSKISADGDSTEMDQVFIPKVTETGGTRLESSTTGVGSENVKRNPIAATAETKKEAIAAVSPNNATVSAVKDTIAGAIEKSENTIASSNFSSSTPPITSEPNARPIITNKNAPEPIVSTPVQSNIIDTISAVSIKNTSVPTSSPQNDISVSSLDNDENNYVKQYKRVTAPANNVAETPTKESIDEIKTADSAAVSTKTDTKALLKTEVAEIDNGVNSKAAVPSGVTKNQNTLTNNGKDIASALPVKDPPAKSSAKATLKEPKIAKTAEAKNKISKTPLVPATTPASQSVLTHNDPVVNIENANNKTTAISGETNTAIKKTSATIDRNVIGKSAEVYTKGKWEKATIIDKETELLYKVHYRGRSADHDEWVPVTHIRKIDSSRTSSTSSVINKLNAAKTDKVKKAYVNCSFEAPAPPVSNSEKFSEKVAKRKIYEEYVNSKNTVKTGITFLSMEAESPIVNSVSISSANVLEIKFPFAPAGALMYPVNTEYKVCEQVLGKTSSITINTSFACFRNQEGAWTCTNLN